MSELALTYARGAVPAAAAYGGRPVAGGGARLVPGLSAMPMEVCAALKDNGEPCGARPAKGTELCVGHLRAQGRL